MSSFHNEGPDSCLPDVWTSCSSLMKDTQTIHSPQPQRPWKRGILEVGNTDTEIVPTKRRCISPQHFLKLLQRSRSDSFLLTMSSSRPTRETRAPSRYEGEPIRPRAHHRRSSVSYIPGLPSPSISPFSSVSARAPSAAESRSTSRVSHPNYRDLLEDNLVWIEPEVVSSDVVQYTSKILKAKRDSPGLSDTRAQAAVDHFRKLQKEGDEVAIRQGFNKFEIVPEDFPEHIKSGNDIPFDSATSCYRELPNPKPDIHYTFSHASFSLEQKYKQSSKTLRPHSTPSTSGHWPYFTVEFKSQAKGGVIWVAENQVATSSARLVYSMDEVLSMTDEQHEQIESITFGCTIDAKDVGFWVAYCVKEEYEGRLQKKVCCVEVERFLMSRKDEVAACYSAFRNIHGWAIRERLPKIMSVLDNIKIDNLDAKEKKQRLHAAEDPEAPLDRRSYLT